MSHSLLRNSSRKRDKYLPSRLSFSSISIYRVLGFVFLFNNAKAPELLGYALNWGCGKALFWFCQAGLALDLGTGKWSGGAVN